MGVVCFTVSLALAIVLAKTGAPPVLRWLLAAPFFLAIVGVSQSLLQTCPFLALKSLRDPGEGIEPVADPGYCRGIVGREGEIGPHLPCSLYEQAHRGTSGDLIAVAF